MYDIYTLMLLILFCFIGVGLGFMLRDYMILKRVVDGKKIYVDGHPYRVIAVWEEEEDDVQ